MTPRKTRVPAITATRVLPESLLDFNDADDLALDEADAPDTVEEGDNDV